MSGDISWSNGMVPGSDLSSLLSGQSTAPTSLSGLALGGSGRIWLKQGGGMRFDVQGSGSGLRRGGRQGRHLELQFGDRHGDSLRRPRGASHPPGVCEPEPAGQRRRPPRCVQLGPAAFRFNRHAVVGPQTAVAGQPSYLLVMTPTSATTTIGSVQVAIDAKTFVPLRVQVFAKGATRPTLSAGFTSVSYGHLGDGLFAFSPPAGTTVHNTALPSPQDLSSGTTASEPAAAKPLTLAEAKAKATGYGLTLAAPSATPADLPFAGATVMAPSKDHGAVAVLHYGAGLGSVVLVEAQGTSGQGAGLGQQIAQLPHGLVTPITVAGRPGFELQTPLVNVAAWRNGTIRRWPPVRCHRHRLVSSWPPFTRAAPS